MRFDVEIGFGVLLSRNAFVVLFIYGVSAFLPHNFDGLFNAEIVVSV